MKAFITSGALTSVVFLLAACAHTSSSLVVETLCYQHPDYVGARVANVCLESNIDAAWFEARGRYVELTLKDVIPAGFARCHYLAPDDYTISFMEAEGYAGTPPTVEKMTIEEGCRYTLTGTYVLEDGAGEVVFNPVALSNERVTFESGMVCINSDIAAVDFTVSERDGEATWEGKTDKCLPLEANGYTVTFYEVTGYEEVPEVIPVELHTDNCVPVTGCYSLAGCFLDSCPGNY